ncbi:MAG: helix-hairpin-helix domain-containing protein [bacterium]|nr:helix-hairpin-helix domain-containing protein [bacterium]
MTNREKYLIGIIIILIGALLFSLNRPVREESKELPIVIEEEEHSPVKIAVHIGGAVRNPGLYYISVDSRVADAIQIAGGPTPDADLDAINLASKLIDGSKILVPSKLKKLDISSGSNTSLGETSVGASVKKININTATAKELEELPGIGPTLAGKIISYRETNGPFKNIEDIKKVSGIGEKKFEAIKDLIIVE